MSALAYPSALPCPKSSQVSPLERRQLSDPSRPREVRVLQRDRGSIERLTWPPLSVAQWQTLRAWWRDDLTLGGSWFAASWPSPRGSVTQVRKFLTPLKRTFLAGGFWSVSAEVEVRGVGELPSSGPTFVDCELLLHFDQSNPANWIDYSTRHHAVTVAGGVSAVPGVWSNQLRLDQAAPGSGGEPDYDSQSYVRAEGLIDLADEDFFISFFMTIDALPPGGGAAAVVSNMARSGGNSHGFEVLVQGSHIGFDFNGGVAEGDATVTAGVRAHYAFSRKFNGERRVLHWFKNGVHMGMDAYDSVQTYGGAQRAYVGCSVRANPLGEEVRIWGFQGEIEELYIVKGAGTGVDASFAVPTEPIGG